MSTTIPAKTVTRYPDGAFVKAAAYLLSPTSPAAYIADLTGRPKNTARSWMSGHRRPPVEVLKAIRQALQARGAEIGSLWSDYNDRLIPRREYEPVKQRGFFVAAQPLHKQR